jgi:caspase domain-containing protein
MSISMILVTMLAAAACLLVDPARAPAQPRTDAVIQATPEKRVALVIGNSKYRHAAALENPRNDATDVAAALRSLQFEVLEAHDLDKSEFDRTLRQFAGQLTGAHVSLFFYAGHGLQVDGQNYLVPVDARLEDAAGIDFELVRLDLVHRTMERGTKTSLLFLDACRDNPLTRNLARALGTRSSAIGKGLSQVESGEGTLISFATQPGNVALDGTGRNSPYTRALVKQLKTAGNDDLSAILIGVRNDVIQETARRQVPWEHSALTARFYFVRPKAAVAAVVPGREFDGVWEVDGQGGERCAVKKWFVRLLLRIDDGAVTSLNPAARASGRVSGPGDLSFTTRAYADRSVTVYHTAKLGDSAGQGTYRDPSGACVGTTTFKRMSN